MFSVKHKVLIARGLSRILLGARGMAGRGAITRVCRRDVMWSLDLREGIDLCIYLQGAYEPRTLRAYLPLIKPGFVVFDIGANVGAHTLHFARLVGPTGSVHAFEPTDYAFEKLRANLALNPAAASIVSANHALLVADRSQPRPDSLYSSWPLRDNDDGLHKEHLGKAMPVGDAQAFTADEYCAMKAVTRLDFVKIDVDGNEFSVLQGFRSSLERFRPKIMIEIAPFVLDELSSGALGDMIEFFVSLRYNFFDVNTHAKIPRDADGLRAIVPGGGSMNALLEPRP